MPIGRDKSARGDRDFLQITLNVESWKPVLVSQIDSPFGRMVTIPISARDGAAVVRGPERVAAEAPGGQNSSARAISEPPAQICEHFLKRVPFL
jgi:hypothetical protein